MVFDLHNAIKDDEIKQLQAENERLTKELEEIKFALQVEEHDNEYNCAERDKFKAENERLRALTEWQPIESAPRDETSILIKWHGDVYHVYWREAYNDWCVMNDGESFSIDEPECWKAISSPQIEEK